MSFVAVRRTLEDQRRFYPIVPGHIVGKAGAGALLKTIKRVGHNRALLTFEDGTQAFMLHTSVIAWRLPSGRIYLDCCGYKTSTTRSALLDARELWNGEWPNYSVKTLPEGVWIN